MFFLSIFILLINLNSCTHNSLSYRSNSSLLDNVLYSNQIVYSSTIESTESDN